MADNRTIMEKADIAVSDLVTNGGFDTEQTNNFIVKLQDLPTMLNEIRVVPMPTPQYTINKIGLGTRVLHGAPAEVVGTTLASAKRVAPTTSKITLNSKEIMAEVHIPYDVLEDNVAGNNLGAIIMSMVMDKVAIDLEELVIKGDTSILESTDDLLCKCDGVLKRATAHVVDNTGAPVAISNAPFLSMIKSMPNQYLRNTKSMRYWVSPHAEMDYANWLGTQRETAYGDSRLISNWGGNTPLGVPLRSCSNVTNDKAIFCDPKNIILGIQRNISVETDKDIRSRVLIFVLTLRVDVQIEEIDAVVKYLGLNVS